MFVINFLKSLVMPQYMARYRKMPIIVSIAIFFLSSIILSIPQMVNMNKYRYDLVDVQNAYNLQVFSSIGIKDIDVLNKTSFNITELGLLYGNDIKKGDVVIYDFNVNNNGSNDFIRIVFDTFDVLDDESSPNKDVLVDFENLEDLDNGNRYLLIIYGNSIVYFNPKGFKELKYNGPVLNFSEITSGEEISYFLMDLYVPSINQQVSFNTFIATVLFPLFIILILWLFLRSTGAPFTFKESYNIGSIAIIVPLVLFFILTWILPKVDLVSIFSTVFGIYYLAIMLVINHKRKIA